MISLPTFSILLAASLASAFNLREQGNYTLQQQLSMSGMEKQESGFQPRIINGEKAAAGQFPYQVALITKYGMCSGALISNAWVLTAAQCTLGKEPITVQLGMLTLKHPHSEYKVDKSNIFHPSSYKGGPQADIALIKIPRVNYTKGIDAVPIPIRFQHNFNTSAIVSGWGSTLNGEDSAPSLQYATLNIISNSECQKSYGGNVIKGGKICARNANSGFCVGDIGAPLVSIKTKILIGLASLGPLQGCVKGFSYGFSRIDFFLEWIWKTIETK